MTNIAVRVIDCHVFRRQGNDVEFLMLKRSEGRIYPGIWQCVTGKIEPDEKPWQTALREMQEETGLTAKGMWSVEHVSHYYEPIEDRMNLIPVFGIEVEPTDVILSEEHTEYRWCSVAEGMELIFWESQADGMRKLAEMITTAPEKSHLLKIHFMD